MIRRAPRALPLVCVMMAVIGTGWICAAGDTWAGDALKKPEGRVILTVSGKITRTNAGDSAEFDMEMLVALGQKTLVTSTPWTDGTQEFGGILMRDVLAAVGAEGHMVEAVALNDYAMGIEISDFQQYPVLLANTLNGEKLRIRDKGPLWIIYPRDDYIELRSQSIDNKMVWQLRRLIVK